MRKLGILCRKLKRITGRAYCVHSYPRGLYHVYSFDDVDGRWEFVARFTTVGQCESFLLSLFR